MHTGIGLRQPHYAQLLGASPQAGLAGRPPRGNEQSGEATFAHDRPALGFVEVHSENFFADGGAALQVLEAARERWPVSLHGVGLALGSAAGLDPWHLDRLAALAAKIDPVRISDHASFARAPRRHGGPVVHAADLLPVAFTDASLALMAANVQRVQDRLKRPILVENLSAYLHWADDRIAEPEFFNTLARRTGCGLLLDVNNLVVNYLNEGASDQGLAVAKAKAWVDAIDPAIVGEIHLAGYNAEGEIVIDDHGSRVHPPVWQVFRHAVARLGPRPVLIEWDTDVPPLDVLLGEAAQAEACFESPLVPLVEAA